MRDLPAAGQASSAGPRRPGGECVVARPASRICFIIQRDVDDMNCRGEVSEMAASFSYRVLPFA